jgi:hypothetical protein
MMQTTGVAHKWTLTRTTSLEKNNILEGETGNGKVGYHSWQWMELFPCETKSIKY